MSLPAAVLLVKMPLSGMWKMPTSSILTPHTAPHASMPLTPVGPPVPLIVMLRITWLAEPHSCFTVPEPVEVELIALPPDVAASLNVVPDTETT